MTNEPSTGTRRRHGRREDVYAKPWTGPYRRYDIVKEFVIALIVMAVAAAGLAAVFGSPDRKPITLAEWARNDPNDFALTAVMELDGSSKSASYGAPYTSDPTAGQKIGPLPTQRWGGVRSPVDAANDFVLKPLSSVSGDAALTAALGAYQGASADQQQKWAKAYDDALTKADNNDPAKVATGDYGPVPVLVAKLVDVASSGNLDGQITLAGGSYQSNYTKPLLFLADGGYLEAQARAEHLGGDQWGMMNETGRYPGQAWLWLYTFWYQVKPFSTSSNGDALVWGLMMVLSLGLILVPFIPGLRSIPRLIPLYRLIWRDHYRSKRD